MSFRTAAAKETKKYDYGAICVFDYRVQSNTRPVLIPQNLNNTRQTYAVRDTLTHVQLGIERSQSRLPSWHVCRKQNVSINRPANSSHDFLGKVHNVRVKISPISNFPVFWWSLQISKMDLQVFTTIAYSYIEENKNCGPTSRTYRVFVGSSSGGTPIFWFLVTSPA